MLLLTPASTSGAAAANAISSSSSSCSHSSSSNDSNNISSSSSFLFIAPLLKKSVLKTAAQLLTPCDVIEGTNPSCSTTDVFSSLRGVAVDMKRHCCSSTGLSLPPNRCSSCQHPVVLESPAVYYGVAEGGAHCMERGGPAVVMVL